MRRTYVYRDGELVEKAQAETRERLEFSVQPDVHFASHQLPRNWEHHKEAGGEFNAKGQPVFSNRKQIEESMARARGEEGTTIYHNEL